MENAMAMIDTLKTARKLERSGFTAVQAEAVVTALAALNSNSRHRIVDPPHRSNGAIAEGIYAEIVAFKQEFIRWLIASHVMVVVLLVILSRFIKIL